MSLAINHDLEDRVSTDRSCGGDTATSRISQESGGKTYDGLKGRHLSRFLSEGAGSFGVGVVLDFRASLSCFLTETRIWIEVCDGRSLTVPEPAKPKGIKSSEAMPTRCPQSNSIHQLQLATPNCDLNCAR